MILRDEIKDILKSDCSHYIEKIRVCNSGDILLRANHSKIEEFGKFSSYLESRKPRNTSAQVHELINDTFLDTFGWKIRNGVFCYGFNLNSKVIPQDLGYGPFYICFPIGDFKIAYSAKVFDMFGEINSLSVEVNTSILKTFELTDKDLCTAINTGERKHNNVSNEISVCVESYYLLNYSFRESILKWIW